MGTRTQWLITLLLAGLFAVVAESNLFAGESTAPVHYTKADLRAGGYGFGFYLTNANYRTNEVLTACAAGYHMASMWELIDPSNLAYAFDHPAAHTKPDSGNGPPSQWYGWVRTGRDSSGSVTAGSGNCLNWSTTDGASSGVSIRLSGDWESSGELNGIWDATSFACTSLGPVWCVANQPKVIFRDRFEASLRTVLSSISP